MSLLDKMITGVRDGLTVQRVFGEPIREGGVVLVPVARLYGGGGGGEGESEQAGERQAGRGSGGGFGLRAVPAGAFVIRGDEVTWQPAVNVTRIVLGGQLVGVVALLVLRTFLKSVVRRDG